MEEDRPEESKQPEEPETPEWVLEIRSREMTMGQADDPEWHRVRQPRLTASVVGAICGLNPYQTANAVLLQKIGKGYGMNAQGREAVRHGQYWEPFAIRYYEQKYNKKVLFFGSIQDPELSWAACSPDGITTDKILIECKCPKSRQIKPGQMPDMYIPQIQFSLHVLRLQECHFIEYIPAASEDEEPQFNLVAVRYDPTWIEEYLPKLISFHERLMFYLENFPKGLIDKCIEYDRAHRWKPPTIASLTKDKDAERKRKQEQNQVFDFSKDEEIKEEPVASASSIPVEPAPAPDAHKRQKTEATFDFLSDDDDA